MDELSLEAPFRGYISERLKEVGDTVEEREAILTVVQLDPLVVELDCALGDTPRLRAGQRVRIAPLDVSQAARVGEVYFVSKVADPASQTFKVKIWVPNADNSWAAGVRVAVDLEQVAVVREEPDQTAGSWTIEALSSVKRGK